MNKPKPKNVLKSWSHWFQDIKAGIKTYDLRDMNDRDFHVGEIIRLREYEQFEGKYTGEELDAEIMYITSKDTPCALSSLALDKDCCILGIRVVETADKEVKEEFPIGCIVEIVSRRGPCLSSHEPLFGSQHKVTGHSGGVVKLGNDYAVLPSEIRRIEE